MPAQLQRRLRDAERALSAVRAEAVQWLGSHPHATDREIAIIRLASQGRTNAEIAAELHLAYHTVRDHWRTLSARWGCRGQAHVVATAFRLGYLEVTDGPELKVVRPA